MNADRELLELAAKAAGHAWDEEMCLRLGGCPTPLLNPAWRPLDDDGQALRLAVKLNIRLSEFSDTIVKSRAVAWKEGAASCSLWEPEGADPYAATRRAIVRAAAAIGEAMP